MYFKIDVIKFNFKALKMKKKNPTTFQPVYQCIDNVPQEEISRYIVVSLFWYTPNEQPVAAL